MGTIILPFHIYCHTVVANNIGEKYFKCRIFVHYVHLKIHFLKKWQHNSPYCKMNHSYPSVVSGILYYNFSF